jgi:membrane protease YdiL (CAAX protease family)
MSNCIFTAGFIAVACIFLPLRSLHRFKKHRSTFHLKWMIMEYILLLFLFFEMKEEQSLSLMKLRFSLPNTWIDIAVYFLGILLVVALDYASLKMMLKRRINVDELSKRKEVAYAWELLSTTNKTLNKLGIVTFCILSGLWEELFFRGIVFYLLTQMHYPLPIVVLVSNFLFALYHFSNGLAQIVYSFFFGLIFSMIFVISGSLIATTISHIAGNLFVLLITVPQLQKKPKEVIFF